VVYVILEGETGFSDRIEAFRQRFLSERKEPVPFYVISQKLNLVADHVQLIADIRAQLPAGVNPAAVAIDTLNRSLQGSESSDQDMGNYVKAADAVRVAFNCVVPIVHHCGIESARPRGHSSLTGAADAQISVRRDQAKNVVTSVEYMKDGPEGDTLVSKLLVVEVGKEPDGHPITSCVVSALGDGEAQEQKAAVQGFALRPTEEPVFRALLTALRKAPVAPNEEMIALGVPADTFATHYRDWREAYKTDGVKGGDAGEPPSDDAIRKQFDRYSRFMISSGGVMGWKRPWLWWTGKHVRGFPETAQAPRRADKFRTVVGQRARSMPWRHRTETGQTADKTRSTDCSARDAQTRTMSKKSEQKHMHGVVLPEPVERTDNRTRSGQRPDNRQAYLWTARRRSGARDRLVGGARCQRYEPPQIWNIGHVDHRLVAAFTVLIPAADSDAPREFGTAMPGYLLRVGGLPRPSRGRSRAQRTGNRLVYRHKGATADEVALMDQALAWPMTYLGRDAEAAEAVLLGSMWKAMEADTERKLARIKLSRRTFFRRRKRGLEAIVASLIRARVVVT
jgi:hypothetical protein